MSAAKEERARAREEEGSSRRGTATHDDHVKMRSWIELCPVVGEEVPECDSNHGSR